MMRHRPGWRQSSPGGAAGLPRPGRDTSIPALSDGGSRELPPRSRRASGRWEATNLLTVAGALTAAAQTRTESRGCHRRTDWTEQRDEWLTHLDVCLDYAGCIAVAGGPRDDG
jgi:hypothetical protein